MQGDITNTTIIHFWRIVNLPGQKKTAPEKPEQ